MSDRVLVGHRADEDVPDVLVEGVDEKGKHLVLSEFSGCLVWLHYPTKQPIHLTGLVNY